MRSFFDPWSLFPLTIHDLYFVLFILISGLIYLYLDNRRVEMKKKHPGFKTVQSKIAKKEGVSKKAAGAILANASRHASSKAKKANPRLKRVK